MSRSVSGGGVGVGPGDHDRWDEDQGERVEYQNVLIGGRQGDLREAGDRSAGGRALREARGDQLPEELRTGRVAGRRWRRRSAGWRSARASDEGVRRSQIPR